MLGVDRCFYRGGHTFRGWGSPLGKLHREGMRVLEEAGFIEVDRDCTQVPAFFWQRRLAAFASRRFSPAGFRRLGGTCIDMDFERADMAHSMTLLDFPDSAGGKVAARLKRRCGYVSLAPVATDPRDEDGAASTPAPS